MRKWMAAGCVLLAGLSGREAAADSMGERPLLDPGLMESIKRERERVRRMERGIWSRDEDAAFAEARRRIALAVSRGERRMLNLGGLKALKILPPELSALKGLSVLNLMGSSVGDLSPLAELTGLGVLELSGAAVGDLSPLAGSTALGRLRLVETSVRDLSPLAGLTALEVLDLSGSPVGDVSPLAGLTGLKILDLSGSPVADVSPLAGLTGLKILDLSGTAVEDLSPLAPLEARGLRIFR